MSEMDFDKESKFSHQTHVAQNMIKQSVVGASKLQIAPKKQRFRTEASRVDITAEADRESGFTTHEEEHRAGDYEFDQSMGDGHDDHDGYVNGLEYDDLKGK